MTAPFTESVVEEAALEWFGALGYEVLAGPTLAPGEPAAERASYEQVVLDGRLRESLRRLNPTVPSEAIEEAFRRLSGVPARQRDRRVRPGARPGFRLAGRKRLARRKPGVEMTSFRTPS